MLHCDVVILGAGAAGLFCAAQAARRGARVVLIDHSERVAEKVRISGGGRANFTNRDLDPAAPHRHFLSANPHFCRSALARYTPRDFIDLLDRHGVPWHEKHKGQLFCDRSAEDLIQLLLDECAAARDHGGEVTRWQPCQVRRVEFQDKSPPSADAESAHSYLIDSDRGPVSAPSLVVATGGLSIPKIGASGFGFDLARQFGLKVTDTRPGLVPLTFDGTAWAPYAQLAGLSLPVAISTGVKKQRTTFHEDLLFTHRGLSGPAVLQISSYWQPRTPMEIDLTPGVDLLGELAGAKARGSRKLITKELAAWLPQRLADAWAAQDAAWQRPINEASDKALHALAERIQRWSLTPTGTEGYKKAEVTVGGVDTRELSSQTLEARRQPGLYFIGEVVDVTGWLGGYNFQWAWASAHACAEALPLHR
ncbi:NAD(P)/FAD-dependent oxidoreductase [Ottowia sp. SB7-C50]|uniref:NAD(P)/FAD-dependent oxidoreductase n=1 Tax=Ottowia sp. SB7-C50 TaxID=3081231 RepID=UPI002953834E|nr:NAD(P)/FAD-dependent oxidoreductase [Ottowia sp. SB7-C50]WOP16868.1 NAD(P)/FAD-dependent oxidoreductase [Ottowia sp. SB7-C50]